MTHTLQANPIRMRQGASALIALLLYHPTEIHSRQRKTSQCVLLQAQIRAAQTGFNEHLDKVLQRKSDDIGVSDRERRGGGGGGGVRLCHESNECVDTISRVPFLYIFFLHLLLAYPM